jgi:putative Holliday junction resolvase
MGRILAIDYGQKRVGIAVTDENQIIATVLTTVLVSEVIGFLKDYLSKEKVDCFVIGEPKTLNNTESDSVKYINPFIKKLKKEFPDIPLERMDERFTSVIASQSLLLAGAKKKTRRKKEVIDGISATLILQSYLESKE